MYTVFGSTAGVLNRRRADTHGWRPRLIALGHSVVGIEHTLDVIKTADWVVDPGPDGGAGLATPTLPRGRAHNRSRP
jgi:hypothetical protein